MKQIATHVRLVFAVLALTSLVIVPGWALNAGGSRQSMAKEEQATRRQNTQSSMFSHHGMQSMQAMTQRMNAMMAQMHGMMGGHSMM